MRILVVSNFYPPYFVGGYELGCRDVVNTLRARGHEVLVLTSRYGSPEATETDGVWRRLESTYGASQHVGRWRMALRLCKRELASQAHLKRLCQSFKPDIVYAWNLTSISASVLFIAQQLNTPVVHFSSDDGLSRWEDTDEWHALINHQPSRIHERVLWRVIRRILRHMEALSPCHSLNPTNVQFASEYLRQNALARNNRLLGEVIHWGIDPGWYDGTRPTRQTQKLLYSGRLHPDKGVHTVIEALGILIEIDGCQESTLTVVGGNGPRSYEDYLRRLVFQCNLGSRVRFTGALDRSALPSILREHDIFVFPVIWDEPFSIGLLEAMAAGLGVVSTVTGGTGEIIEDGVNALVFPSEDARACATQAARLVQQPSLLELIRANAQRRVLNDFSLATMVDKVERSLRSAVEVGASTSDR